MDDPNKVKSIKVEKGYIGVTWWEELDQFAGENEMRKVLQSTMRGGKDFWNFMTFNPPISRNNWANEYAEDMKDRDGVLVTHNTYLDVPPEWLGYPFFEEAELLKERNERAYAHEFNVDAEMGNEAFAMTVDDVDAASANRARSNQANFHCHVLSTLLFSFSYAHITQPETSGPHRFQLRTEYPQNGNPT